MSRTAACHADNPSRCSAPVTEGVVSLRITPRLGGPAATAQLRYSLDGRRDGPWRVVLGGISAGHRPGGEGGWWPQQVGPGRAIDTSECAVLGLEYLGELPEGWRGVTPHDQAALVAAALDAFGVDTVEAVIGASYGGAVALAFGERWPERVRRVVVLSAAHRPAPMASAQRAIQREILRAGIAAGTPEQAVALARALAVTTYRSDAEFAQRFAGGPEWRDGRWQLPVEGYLEAQGARFAARFTAQRYLVLSESLDLHRIEPAALRAPLDLFAVREDRLVPAEDIHALASACGAEVNEISSLYGHDAFLKEEGEVAAWLRRSLAAARGQGGRMRPIAASA